MSPRDQIAAFLVAQTTLTLATANADGSPHACDLFYASADDLALYFLSDPKTRHIESLQREPRVSATIHAPSRGWEDIRGLQIVGIASRVDDAAERVHAFARYVAKYLFVRQWLPSVDALGKWHEQFGVVELYKITPRWLRWIDNAEGIAHKEEIEL